MIEKLAQKVLLVIVEGLDSVAFRKVVAANFEMLRQAGASTLAVDAALIPSSTANLMSVLTSSANRIATGNRIHKAEIQSNVINFAHQRGRSISVFHNNSALNRLLDHSAAKDFCFLNARVDEYDFKMMHLAAECIRIDRPDLCFVFIGWNDHPYRIRPQSSVEDYERMAETSDRALGIILNMMSLFGLFKQYHILLLGIPSKASFLVHSKPAIAKVPWIILGPCIKQGHSISNRVSLLDTAPTISKLLELPQLSVWEGHPVTEIFAECDRELMSVA